MYWELKKNPSVDLERIRPLLLSGSLAITMGLITLAFNWKSYDKEDEKIQLRTTVQLEDVVEEVPSTEIPPPPPPPTLQMTKLVEVSDAKKIEEDLNVNFDMEITDQTVMQEYTYVEPVKVEAEIPEEIFMVVEQTAAPQNGLAGFYKYVGENIHYPAQAARMGVQGKVFVQFVVEKDGTLNQLTVVKGIGAGCDEEAVRILEKSPAWFPGKQRGKPVRQRMVFPIFFKLMEH